MKPRKNLSGEAQHLLISQVFLKIPDHRPRKQSVGIRLKDALMSGFAVFALKMPSLLQFDGRRKEYHAKLKSVFGIDLAPCDTQMREIIDEVDPEMIRPAFKRLLFEVQRGKGLEDYVFYQGHYLIAAGGTGHFSSDSVHCEDCLVKESKSGKVCYQHQMLAAAIVHPTQKIVLPLCPEPIKKQDGNTKNDCERNAGKRFLKKFREDHPKLKAVFVEDALSGNAPRIEDLNEANLRFILGAKPGSNKYLFEQVERLDREGRMNHFQQEAKAGQKIPKTITHRFRYLNGLRLNAANDTIVNFLEYWETTEWTDRKGVSHKKEKQLTVDQVQQLSCELFQKALARVNGTRRSLWETVRVLFEQWTFASWSQLLEAIAYPERWALVSVNSS